MKKIISNINRNQALKAFYLLIVILSVSSIIHAQPPIPGGDPNTAPIDGGLSLLIAGGVGYGVKKMKEKEMKRRTKK